MSAPPIETENLSKIYKTGLVKRKEFEALKSLSISVAEGEIFAFLGPNGAGKTTTINLLMGFLQPTSGAVKLFGQNPDTHAVKQKLGYLPDNYSFYPYMTPTQLLGYFAELFGIDKAQCALRVEKLLTQMDLWQVRNRPIGSFSRGMKQRLGIVQALMNNPALLILDEPTSGFDPAGRKMVHDLLIELKQGGTSILLSSHILSEVETVCDRVVIINKGRLLREGTLQEILGTKTYEVRYSNEFESIEDELNQLDASLITSPERGFIVTQNFELAQRAVKIIVSNNGTLESLIPKANSLEDVFLDTVDSPSVQNVPAAKTEMLNEQN